MERRSTGRLAVSDGAWRISSIATRAGALLAVATMLVACASTATSERGPGSVGTSVPALFVHDRILVVAPSVDRPELRFFADSGGGFNAIDEAVARRLALAEIGTLPGEDGGPPSTLVAFPDVMTRAGIPSSDPAGVFKGGLVAVPPDQAMFFRAEGCDGFLGGRWFDGHAWEIDYVRQTLRILQRVAPLDPSHRVTLGFQEAAGRRTSAFARMPVEVDGESLQMLFDTGATATLADGAAKVIGEPSGSHVATSFITRSVSERWVGRHPEWRVIADGDRLGRNVSPMIEVSRVSIGGLEVGPVWFAQRPDRNFRDFMSSMMDGPVDGAIGGSVLHHVRVTIDYPSATAYFERSAR